MSLLDTCLQSVWPAPPNVRTLITTRQGGVSLPPYTSLNLGARVGDASLALIENRQRLSLLLPAEPAWLLQVHGAHVIEAFLPSSGQVEPEADASYAHCSGLVCAVQTADCLPVLLCDRAGNVVAAAHAGWRGLLAGVLENTVAAMRVPPETVLAWFGPAIGPDVFEVGAEVRQAFMAHSLVAELAFRRQVNGRYLANIYQLARQRLAAIGVTEIYGGEFCTVSETGRFFSYRRDKITGRQASLIWLA